MGFFSRDIEATPSIPPVEVSSYVAEALPDAGNILVEIVGGYDAASASLTETEIERVRHANGGLPRALRRDVPSQASGGPLFLLNWITTLEAITFDVWATSGLRGATKKHVQVNSASILEHQGLPAAATWVLSARAGDGGARLDSLARSLEAAYEEWVAKLTNGMLIDAFRKWKR